MSDDQLNLQCDTLFALRVGGSDGEDEELLWYAVGFLYLESRSRCWRTRWQFARHRYRLAPTAKCGSVRTSTQSRLVHLRLPRRRSMLITINRRSQMWMRAREGPLSTPSLLSFSSPAESQVSNIVTSMYLGCKILCLSFTWKDWILICLHGISIVIGINLLMKYLLPNNGMTQELVEVLKERERLG